MKAILISSKYTSIFRWLSTALIKEESFRTYSIGIKRDGKFMVSIDGIRVYKAEFTNEILDEMGFAEDHLYTPIVNRVKEIIFKEVPMCAEYPNYNKVIPKLRDTDIHGKFIVENESNSNLINSFSTIQHEMGVRINLNDKYFSQIIGEKTLIQKKHSVVNWSFHTKSEKLELSPILLESKLHDIKLTAVLMPMHTKTQ